MNKVVAFVCALSISAVGAGLGSLSTKAIHAEGGITKVLSPVGIMRTAKDTVVITGSKLTQLLFGDTIVTIGSVTEHDDLGRPVEFISEMEFMGDSMFGRTDYEYSADGKTVTMTSQLKESADSDWVPELRMEMGMFDESHLQTGILYQELRMYAWDESLGGWVLESHSRAEWSGGTVDCPERITETTLDTATGNWDESGRMHLVCNSDGTPTEMSMESIYEETGEWYEDFRYTYLYDEEGRLEKADMEMRMDPSSEMEHFATTEYTYGTISLATQPPSRHSAQDQPANCRAPVYDLRGRRIEDHRKAEFSGASALLVRVSPDGTRSWKRMPALDH